MASKRRRAPAESDMRARLIEAAVEIIREKGQHALTSRTLADRLSLKRQILHYYFESMDELLVQLVRVSHAEVTLAFELAATAENPLQAIWDISRDPRYAVLSLELAALAARREPVRDVVRDCAEALRALQVRILREHLAARGIEPTIDLEFATLLISSISQTLAQERMVGAIAGHRAAERIVSAALDEFVQCGRVNFRPAATQENARG